MAAAVSSSARSRGNAFALPELDRASEWRENAAVLAERAGAPTARYILLRADGHALVASDRSGLHAFGAQDRAQLAPHAAATFLGCANGSDYFLVTAEAAEAERITRENAGIFLDLRSAGGVFNAFD